MARILLVNPSQQKDVLTTVNCLRFPPLNLQILRQITDRKLSYDFDLVGITAMTSTAPRAYEISRKFIERGIPTILGGIHPTMMPEEASRFATSVVKGEAEMVWPEVIKDFERENLKPVYEGGLIDAYQIPVITDRLKGRFFIKKTIQSARGCPMNCDFCSVTSFNGRKYRSRNLGDVLKELESIDTDKIFFVDDNIFGYGNAAEQRAINLFRAMVERGLSIKWASQASLNVADSDEALYWAAKSGAKGFFIGFESLNPEVLKKMGKAINLRTHTNNYKSKIKRIQDYGIAVVGGFILGNDDDTKETFDLTTDFVLDSGIDATQFTILTPLPGTRLFKRICNEGRMLYSDFPTDWKYFDTFHVVFQPRNFEPKSLEYQVLKMYEKTGNLTRCLERMFGTLTRTRDIDTTLGAGMLNYGYYKGVKRIVERQDERK